jgi:hypothetical protein
MEEDPNPSADLPLPEKSPVERPLLFSSPTIEFYEPPRLGIIHLLAWVTVAAVLMKYNLALDVFHPSLDNESVLKVIFKIFQAGSDILRAAILVGGVVFWLDRIRQKPGKIQPGHWIVGIESLRTLSIVLMDWLHNTPYFSSYLVYFLYYTLTTLLVSLAFGWGALRLPEPSRWKWALGMFGLDRLYLALNNVVVCFFTPPFILDWPLIKSYIQYSVAAFFILVVLIDLVKGLRRDWLHWLGAVSPIVSLLMTIASHVVHEFFHL